MIDLKVTAEEYKVDLDISIGRSQGPQGPAGPAGEDGESAYDVWLGQGNDGTEDDFIDTVQYHTEASVVSFVNQASVTVPYRGLFRGHVYLYDGTADLQSTSVQVTFDEDTRVFMPIGVLSIDADGEWSSASETNAFRSADGDYLVRLHNGQWVIGSLSDHNQGGFAGVEYVTLGQGGTLPYSFGGYDIVLDISSLNSGLFVPSEPVLEFNQPDGLVTVGFGGTKQTGYIIL